MSKFGNLALLALLPIAACETDTPVEVSFSQCFSHDDELKLRKLSDSEIAEPLHCITQAILRWNKERALENAQILGSDLQCFDDREIEASRCSKKPMEENNLSNDPRCEAVQAIIQNNIGNVIFKKGSNLLLITCQFQDGQTCGARVAIHADSKPEDTMIIHSVQPHIAEITKACKEGTVEEFFGKN